MCVVVADRLMRPFYINRPKALRGLVGFKISKNQFFFAYLIIQYV